MTPAEAAMLLTVAASFDNRKPDPDAAKAWAVALEGYRFEDCRDAIVRHFRSTSEYLLPVHVIRGVKAIRKQRLDDHPLPPVPVGMTDAAELTWKRDMRDRIANGEVFPIPELPAGAPPAAVKALAAGWRGDR